MPPFWVKSAVADAHPLPMQLLRQASKSASKNKAGPGKLVATLLKSKPSGDAETEYQSYFAEHLSALNRLSPLALTRTAIV